MTAEAAHQADFMADMTALKVESILRATAMDSCVTGCRYVGQEGTMQHSKGGCGAEIIHDDRNPSQTDGESR